MFDVHNIQRSINVGWVALLFIKKQGRKLYIDAGKDLKIHKISKSVTLLITHYLKRQVFLTLG